MIEADHLVELAADLLGDGLAAFGRAVLLGRIEPGLEQPDQEPGDGRVGPQHPLHVVLAEPHAALAQVLRGRAQQRHLTPGQPGGQHQRVEPVVFGLAVPQRGQGLLEDQAQATGRGDRRRPETKFIYPERPGARAPGELVRVLVHDLESHVLQLRQHVGQRDRRARPVDDQRPPLRVLDQPDRELPTRLPQSEHHGQVVDRVLRGDVRLVRLGDARPAQLEQDPGPLLAEDPDRLGGQVLVPGPDRGGQPALQRGRVHLRHHLAALRPDHHVQAGQGRVADGGAVVHRRPVQGLAQDLLRAQPDLRGVPVPGQVHQAGHVPAVAVPAQEQPGLLALGEPQHAQRDRGELVGGDLEEFFARIVLQDLDQVLAVMAVGGQPGFGQNVGQLAPDDRDAGDGRGVRRMGVQAEEAVLPGDRAVSISGSIFGRPEPLDRDVVQVAGPVDGGPGVRLGQYHPFARVLGPARNLGRQLAQQGSALPVVPQDAEPGSGHRAQAGALRGPDQVVFAIAEKGEVAGRQPAQQVAELGRDRYWAPRPGRRPACGRRPPSAGSLRRPPARPRARGAGPTPAPRP